MVMVALRGVGAALLWLILVGLSAVAMGQQLLVDDFELTANLGKYINPTDIAFLPGGSMLATNRYGLLTLSPSGRYNRPLTILDLRNRTCENGERGLLSVTPHPEYGRDYPFLYIFYTYKKHGDCLEDGDIGPVNRISRFTFIPGAYGCDKNSEFVLLETPSLPFDHHNGGDIAFGRHDGLLYATMGDAGVMEMAQDNTNLFGTIVRLTPEGNIPASNPYSFESGHRNSKRCNGTELISTSIMFCQEIFAYGFRNPFRFVMNPSAPKTQFYVNDVGAALWEEISVGGDGYEGANYGWPNREGPCRRGRDCGVGNCTLSLAHEPVHFYHHNADGDAAVTAGAFVPQGAWSQEYDGKYLWADFVFGQLFRMDYTGGENRRICPVESNYEGIPLLFYNNSAIVAMEFGPLTSGTRRDLYIMFRGFGGRLGRVTYVGIGNRSPEAKILASTISAMPGTTIWFDGATTTDPDGDALTFEWDFNVDGVADSTGSTASFNFNSTGLFHVTMTARDGKGGESTTSIEIGIGKRPSVLILSPVPDYEFVVGEQLLLVGSVYVGPDEEQADYSEMWEVRQHHSTHYHPFLSPVLGNNILLQPAPSPEDFLASTNSYLEVILTVTNKSGLKTTVSRNVMPRKVNVEIDSYPPGHIVLVDEYEVTTPTTFVTWLNHSLTVEALTSDQITGEPTWTGWSNGVSERSQVVQITEQTDTLRLVAFFEATQAPSITASPTMTYSPTPNPSTVPSFHPTATSSPTFVIRSSIPSSEPRSSEAEEGGMGKLGILILTCVCALIVSIVLLATTTLVRRCFNKRKQSRNR